MFELGVREKDTFIEMTGEQLLREGAKGAAQAIEKAMGGVLFVDEAYTLEPKSNAEGRAIMNQIMAAAENQRAEISIILAGYKQDIEDKLCASSLPQAACLGSRLMLFATHVRPEDAHLTLPLSLAIRKVRLQPGHQEPLPRHHL